MLKNTYKNAIDKYVPDSALIESTKNAMRNELGSLNSDKSAVIALAPQTSAKITFWQKYGKFAAGAACIALLIGTAVGVSVYLDKDDITNKQDAFASSGHQAFDGDAANDGDDSVQMEITQTTTAVTTAATNRVNNIQTQAQTSVVSTTSATTSAVTTQAAVQTTQALQTTRAMRTEATAQTAKTTTSATVTTAVITTTTTAVQTTTAVTPPQDFDGEHRPHFGYYDPQYDPNFKGGFGGGFGEEFLFEHQGVFYYFDMHKSDKVKVDIEGQEFTLRQALDDKMIAPEDLLAFDGFICKGYYNNDKNATPIDVHPEYEQQMHQQGGFMQNEEENPANGESGQNNLNPAEGYENTEEIPQ